MHPTERHAPLEMSPEEFRAAGHAVVDRIADFLGAVRTLPVTRAASPREMRALLPQGGVPETGADALALLDETARLLVGHSLFNGHPRFFGYITSSAAPIGALADLLAAAVNPNVGGWNLSPLASEIEGQCVRWIGELLGFRAGGGLLVSGGNMANITAFLAARRAVAGPNLRERGLGAARGPLRVYASTETHTWIHKAADLSGIGTEGIRWIPVNAERRVDVAAMERRIEEDEAAGDRPFLVIGNAGTVSTGAVDPLDYLATLARFRGLWFHVDGAYGAFAAAVPEESAAFRGIGEADSVAVDPHKWLYAPLEAGCVLVRDGNALADAFRFTAPYYRFEGEETDPRINYYENGLQNSRGFRALKVWLGLRHAGLEGYRQMIGDDIRLARELYCAAVAHPELEAGTCGLSIATFRYVPEDLQPLAAGEAEYLDALNEALLERLMDGGEVFLSNAVLDGRFYLRACIVNFRTSSADVGAVPEIVARYGREVDREMRAR